MRLKKQFGRNKAGSVLIKIMEEFSDDFDLHVCPERQLKERIYKMNSKQK